MHRRRGLVATDDAHVRAWIEAALSSLGITFRHLGRDDLAAAIAGDPGDLVIAEAGANVQDVVALAEEAVAAGADLRLLLVVEPTALESLRLPVRFPCDFVLRSATREELVARVRALAWPGEEVRADEIIGSGELMVNLATYQVSIKGEPAEFTYLEYALFVFLLTHPNRVYSRDVLLSRVWGHSYFGGDRTVDVHVRRVRAKLGPEVSARLETVRGVGYLWRA